MYTSFTEKRIEQVNKHKFVYYPEVPACIYDNRIKKCLKRGYTERAMLLLLCVTNVIWIMEEKEEEQVVVVVDEKKGRHGYCTVHIASSK